MKFIYENDVAASPLEGKCVSVVGFGNQGRAHAENLKDSGVTVIVALRRSSSSRQSALEAGFAVHPIDEAARALVYQAARHIDSGAKDISKISAMAKVYASDVAMSVTTDAVQILRGEIPIYSCWHESVTSLRWRLHPPTHRLRT